MGAKKAEENDVNIECRVVDLFDGIYDKFDLLLINPQQFQVRSLRNSVMNCANIPVSVHAVVGLVMAVPTVSMLSDDS